MELTNCFGDACEIKPYLKLYEDKNYNEVQEWIWDELYHQGDIGTASIAWILEANEYFLKQREDLDWDYLGFVYRVMQSLEYYNVIACPDWAKNKYRDSATKALNHALRYFPEEPNQEQQLSVLCLTCAITKTYDSYTLLEYGWGYEEKLMDTEF